MNADFRSIVLSDNRSLAYESYGYQNGFPIIALHGLPGSRIWFKTDDDIATSLGVHLITVDRPGYGQSDINPAHSFLSFARDLNELIQFLDIEEHSILGVSGGGTFAAAYAFQASHKLKKVGLISTVKPFESGKPPKEMAFANRVFFSLARFFPTLLRFFLHQQKKALDHKPEDYLISSQKNVAHLCEYDQIIMQDSEIAETMYLHITEAYRNEVNGAVQEAILFTQPWGFELKSIETQVELWHGTADTLAPISMVKEMSQYFRNCNEHFLVDKGHFISEEDEVWNNMLTSLKE
ncbi:MAG: alpha/beta hydrolase [Balneolaceae bacterium]|nr:alpha/beta hydrolase [Balneolaceae bacterium]